jgi:hypothetical protein
MVIKKDCEEAAKGLLTDIALEGEWINGQEK